MNSALESLPQRTLSADRAVPFPAPDRGTPEPWSTLLLGGLGKALPQPAAAAKLAERTGGPPVDRAAETHSRLDPPVPTTAVNGPDGEAVESLPPVWDDLPAVELRYRPLRLHATGGVGEVYIAEDEELHREVALKRIQPRRVHEEDKQRFLLEAEITARLEHPGVVPVYGLVTGPDGRACYAMRLIRGETFIEAIRSFHRASGAARRAFSRRSLGLRQLLNRFIAVCGTVAYAHSRGILHCDLKPSNIMLGKYGETLVVDWGLAKPFDRNGVHGADAEKTLRPCSHDSLSDLDFAPAMGTPAYMSPEQSTGRWQLVGPASDVYSLGATLYTLLTGRVPFWDRDRDVASILTKVRLGNFPPPRQVQTYVPRPLEAICLKAMALKPEDRYPSPLALADDLENWLAGATISAHREPWYHRFARRAGRLGAFLK